MTTWNGFKIDRDNIPLRRPGVYMITDLTNGRRYIGCSSNVGRRIVGHKNNKGKVLYHRIQILGVEQFYAQPLYYALDKNNNKLADLIEIEYQLILLWKSLEPKGYNRVAKINDRSHRALIAKAVGSEKTRKKMSESQKQRYLDPNERTKTSEQVRASLTPERSKKLSISRRGRIWITNGLENKPIWPEAGIPNGWRRGKTHHSPNPKSQGELIKVSRTGTVWITDGNLTKALRRGDPIPSGWRRGMA